MAVTDPADDKRFGNQFWKARTKHGRDKLFEDESVLWEACCEYFQWVDNNPLFESKLASASGEPTIVKVDKPRPYTIGGMCVFLDISQQTWADYRVRDGFIGICNKVEDIIRDQKFSGASVGLFNANIIARDLGLKEATTNEHSGPGGGPIKTQEITFVGVNGSSE